MARKWTQRHYEASAEIFREALTMARTMVEKESIEYAAGRFALMYAADNPRFDGARWDAAIFGEAARA